MPSKRLGARERHHLTVRRDCFAAMSTHGYASPGRELTLFPSEMTFTGIPPRKLQPAFAELKLASQTATAHQGFPCTLRHQPGHHYRAGRHVRKARGPPRPDRCTRRSPPMAPLLPCCRELFKHSERDAGGAGVVQIAEDGTNDRSGRQPRNQAASTGCCVG